MPDPPAQSSFYTDPVIYDILYTPGTAREVDVLERIHRQYVTDRVRSAPWLEPACGTGRYLRVVARRGYRVVGFDREVVLVDYATVALRRRGLGGRVKLFVADMVDFYPRLPTAPFGFAFNLVNSIRHLASDSAVLAHFRQMAALLAPGGRYAVGLSLHDYGMAQPDEDVWIGVRGRCRVTQVVNYLPPVVGGRTSRRERVISHLMVERPRGEEHLDAVYDLRTYDAEQWRRLLARSALRRIASLDSRGRPLGKRRVPYQIEILAVR
ncbi:MAG: class I SAM-dependent methyltransferase [bacterium]